MVVFMVTLNYIAQLAPLEAAAKNNQWYGTESHECVALVKPWIPGKTTKQWKRGAQVKGNKGLATGTCIASFQYSPSKGYFYDGAIGGHGAVYVSQDSTGITVYDQWRTQPCHKRVIRFKGDGSKQNDGNEFYVIE
ncbi:BPSL0067_family protein [Hexamita inflata]|uniref:BPSL0067 family protein n=1 Tax=Hexamita inflata TaxID=28002 RepID=A0AA86QI76_9EUKA|nr:BPSL0067 family protein [Hexamita inflata]